MHPHDCICKNCKTTFATAPESADFYRKIGLTAPALCPQCRLQRRLAWRNERRLYRRACDLCHASMIAMYPPGTAFPVYCRECWWGDGWDQLSFGKEYDFSKKFFDQFKELSDKVPHLGLPNPSNNFDCDYTSWADECKSCYMVFGSTRCEEVLNAELLYACKNSMDSTNCNELELSYQCVNSKKCYRTIWGVNCVSCSESAFCFDCRNCTNCFLSFNLRNKSYCFLNTQYGKEEWKRKTTEIMGSHEKMQAALLQFRNIVRMQALHRFSNFVQCVNSTGNDLFESKNAFNCFDSSKLEDCHYVTYGAEIKDCQDCYAIVNQSELCYESISATNMAQSVSVIGGWGDVFGLHACQYLASSHDCIGCYALRKKEYCILNRQYSKEEYEMLSKKVIAHMKANGEYGEFFPIALSPFGYNESLAYDYFPLTRNEAFMKGYPWQEKATGMYGKETVAADAIPDSVHDVPDTLIKEILPCVTCGKNYRVLQKELNFYRQLHIPVPRKCADCRYHDRLLFRNPRKLWQRNCMCAGEIARRGEEIAYRNSAAHFHGSAPCPDQFQTSYAPDRPEIVYSEQCYQAEVL